MSTIAVNVRRRDSQRQPLDLEADLRLARALARMLDAEFGVGGIRFGFDAIVGLVPIIGDTLALLVGIYPIYVARKHKLGRSVQLRMAVNLGIDYLAGLVPVVGDLFDVAFKANLRNLAILERAAARPA
jgi:hypothetical protein